MKHSRFVICSMIRKLKPVPGGRRLCPGREQSDPREGGAFLTVVVLTAIMALVLSTLASASLQRVHILRMETNRIRAQAIAEAGLSTVFAMLSEDASVAQGTNPVATDDDFAGGAYEVHVATPMQGVVLITSTGQFRNRDYTTVATVRIRETIDDHDDTPDPTTLLGPLGNVALFAGNKIELSGNPSVYLGAFGAHANGEMDLGGGSFWAKYISTNGNMTLSGKEVDLDGGAGRMHANGLVTLKNVTINASQITSSTGITGYSGTATIVTNAEPVPPMLLPQLDVEAFRSLAESDGHYYEGGKDLETVIAPAGGVVFVNGDARVNAQMKLQGIIVATGDIRVNGGATLNNHTPYPSLVSVNGNITINGNAKCPEGWIYAMNGTVRANGTASGGTGIVAARNITIGGNFTLGNPSTSGFTSPGQQPGEGGGGDPVPGTGGGPIKLLSWIR